jgi:flagellar hook protein FlgE
LAPKATTSVNVAANLSANTAVNGTFSTTITVYDSLGNGEPANLTFTKTANNAWSYAATVTTQDATGQSSTQSIGGGTLTFDPSSGNLTANTPTQTPAVTLPGSGATIPSITYDFGSASGSGTGGLTQSASDSVVSSQGQNGYTSGDLSGVQVGQDGTVSGVYSNGQTIAVGQLAIAKFPSNPGLTCAGNNLWIPSQGSGTPALGAAGAGGRGAITAGSLEQSNVDITAQFVDLIAQQRAFQADSKTITTADQMMQDLMQMKQ